MPTIRKKVKKFALQDPHESRIVWRHLTEALEREDSEAASEAKHEVSGNEENLLPKSVATLHLLLFFGVL